MPHVDLCFGVAGERLPVDHAYALYGAISRLCPEVHDGSPVACCPIRGTSVGQRELQLTAASALRIRTPIERVPELLKLSGKALELDGFRICLGVPRIRAIQPAARLYSPLVTIKGFKEPGPFLEAVKRRITGASAAAGELGMSPSVEPVIPLRRQGPHAGEPMRRVLRIKDMRVVGFALLVTGLTAEDSLLLQERGLGGRRRMGCGVFLPVAARGAGEHETA